MEKKALLFTILTFVLCLSLIAGSTFSLFTSESKVNVAVTAGNVEVVATVENIQLGSTLETNLAETSANYDETGNTITLENIVPGDFVSFDLRIQNKSTVSIKYRTVITKVADDGLWDGLDVTIDGTEYDGAKKASGWSTLAPGSEDIIVPVTVTLPEDAGNEYMLKTCTFAYTVEAVQGNADLTNGVDIPEDAVAVSNFEEFTNALAAGGNYEITAPFTVEGILTVSADTKLYNANSENVLTFAQNARLKTAENVDLALYGIVIDGGGSFEMVDGEFTTDSTACNSDAILMAYAGSTLTLGEGTVIENVVSNSPAVAWAKGTVDNRATIIFDGATVRNCAGGSGTVINVDNYGDVYIEEGTVITGNVSYNQSNHGIIRIYNPWDAENVSTLTMNGGEITDNYFSANGAIGLYYGKMIMNGGEISGNSWYSYNGKTNGFYCVVYVHSQSQFIMNGGEISGNTITDGAINAINSSVEGAITFNGGTVTNNINTRNDNKDALAAVCYPYSMQKTLVISENANVTGTVYNHAIEGNVVVRNYSEISEYFGE